MCGTDCRSEATRSPPRVLTAARQGGQWGHRNSARGLVAALVTAERRAGRQWLGRGEGRALIQVAVRQRTRLPYLVRWAGVVVSLGPARKRGRR